MDIHITLYIYIYSNRASLPAPLVGPGDSSGALNSTRGVCIISGKRCWHGYRRRCTTRISISAGTLLLVTCNFSVRALAGAVVMSPPPLP